jgi:hypothetical protein
MSAGGYRSTDLTIAKTSIAGGRDSQPAKVIISLIPAEIHWAILLGLRTG